MLNLQSVYFGQRHKDFTYEDFDLICKISRLARKHHKQAENDCNGVGYVKGQVYYTGNIDDFAKKTYGYNVKDAYLTKDCEETIFNLESNKIESKINGLILENIGKTKSASAFKVEFQGDPRGNTVKLFYENEQIDLL